MEALYPAQLVGWVVWGKVRSLPWWPGQVMHPSKGPAEVRKMAAMKTNAGKLLVMFLGDNKYAFLTRDSVVDFVEYRDRHSSTNYASKFWKLGLEEAEEILARRTGLQPATDHEPVDLAAKKANFGLLAKAWAGEASPSKQAGGSGRAPERPKTAASHSETPKLMTPTLSAKGGKSSPSACSVRELGKSLRAHVPDDGRMKSIGGVVLEWTRYMPLAAATRKGAEASTSDLTLRFVRRLARGEEFSEGPLDDHGLQLLHSLCLQRRLQTVEVVARPASGGPTTTDGQECSGSGTSDSVSKANLPIAGLGGTCGPRSVLVQEVFLVADAAAIPLPVAVWDALRVVLCEAASLNSDGQKHHGGASDDASIPQDILKGDFAGAGEDAAKALVTDPSSGAPSPAVTGVLQVLQLEVVELAHAHRSIDVDVVLKVNGKFLPHLTPGRIAWNDAPLCGGVIGAHCAAVQGIQLIEEPEMASKLVDDTQGPPLPQSTTQMACQPVTVKGSWSEGGFDRPPIQLQLHLKQVPRAVSWARTPGTAEAGPAAGAALSQPPLSADIAATPSSAISSPSPQALPPPTLPLGTLPASTTPTDPAQLPSGTTTAAAAAGTPPIFLSITCPLLPTGDAPVTTGTSAAYAPLSRQLEATPLRGPTTNAAIISPDSPPAPPSSAAQPPVAALDLSLGLVPWLRGEIRVTSWTVAGPRLLLITISADRKRDGGLGGIKREARLLLAEAKERRATSPEGQGATNEEAEGEAGEEPKLKHRLRSAAAAPSPAVCPAALGGALGSAQSQGQVGGKVSQPQQPRTRQAGSLHEQHPFESQAQAGVSVGGSQSADGRPSSLALGPAAAVLMRSRILQQKRSANTAMAAAAATAGAAGAAFPGGKGAPEGLRPHAGNEATKTSSCTGGGTGGTSDCRTAKKVKLVRFPMAAASTATPAGTAAAGNSATASALPRMYNAGVVPAAGAAAGAGHLQAVESGSARRRVTHSHYLAVDGNAIPDDGMDESGLQGAVLGAGCDSIYGLGSAGTVVGGTVGGGLSCFGQDWDAWYPPWLPQPAQKGPFITISRHLRNSQHNQHQAHLNRMQSQHHYKSTARGGFTSTAHLPPKPSHFRLANYHSYNHQLQKASAPYQPPSGALGSPRYGNTSHSMQCRSFAYDGCNVPDEQPSAERRMDYCSGSGRESYYPRGPAMTASGWLPQPPATAASYGVVSPVAANGNSGIAGPLAAGSGDSCCGRILLDIRVSDESDSDACPVVSNYADAAVHLAPEMPAAAGSSATKILPTFTIHHAPHHHGDLYPSSAAAHPDPAHVDAVTYRNLNSSNPRVAGGKHAPHVLPAVSPFAEQLSRSLSPCAGASTWPIAPLIKGPTESSIATIGVELISSVKAAATAITAAGSIVCPFGGMMTAANQDLAAATLAESRMCACKSVEMKDSNERRARSPAVDAAAGAVGAAGAKITATVTKCIGASAAAAMVPRARMMLDKGSAVVHVTADASAKERVAAAAPEAEMLPQSASSLSCVVAYEEDIVRLQRECELPRDQVKLRLAPGSLDRLPQQQLPYTGLVVQVSEQILALALQLPTLSGPAKETFIQFSRTLMQEATVYGMAAGATTQQQLERPIMVTTAAVPGAPVAAAACCLDAVNGDNYGIHGKQNGSGAVASVRSLAVARVAADLVRSATAPCLPLHSEDRWAFINLAAKLL